MRILFAADVHPNPDSGAAGTEWQTIASLRELGHEVDTIWAEDLGRRIQHGNLHYLLELPLRYRQVIAQRCERREFDVLHVNQGHCYLAALDHRKRNRRSVFVCRSHGLDDHMERVLAPWRRRLGVDAPSGARRLVSSLLWRALARHDRLAYRYADGVLVSASHDAEYLTQTMRVAPERVAAVAQAPASAFVARDATPMTATRARKLLHVGGFAYWKGVHAVAQAANLLLPGAPDATLTWVCREEEHEKVLTLLAPTVRAQVALRPWVSQLELCRIYDDHGIFLAPSLFEGFGKVFLEAMARGLIVIGTATGGMRDIIRPDQNGFIVPFHDPQALVAAVRCCWERPDASNRMSTAAAGRAREYAWQRTASEIVAFYRRLAKLRAADAR